MVKGLRTDIKGVVSERMPVIDNKMTLINKLERFKMRQLKLTGFKDTGSMYSEDDQEDPTVVVTFNKSFGNFGSLNPRNIINTNHHVTAR